MTRTPMTSLMALILAAPLAATPALAEQHESETGMSDSEMEATDDGSATIPTADGQDGESVATGTDGEPEMTDGTSQTAESTSEMEGNASDPLIVTVADSEIRGSDVEQMMMAFPAQLRQSQPTETLVPMAVEQLVLRELILQDAMSQNMAEDEDVQQMVSDNAQRSEEDAMVQVYMERELEGAVTDDLVQQTYDDVTADAEGEVPDLEAVRPQIEQQLRQQRFAEMSDELREGVEIVYYGPDGEPMEADASGTMGSDSDSQSGETSDNAPMDSAVEDAPETDGEYGSDGSAESDDDTSSN